MTDGDPAQMAQAGATAAEGTAGTEAGAGAGAEGEAKLLEAITAATEKTVPKGKPPAANPAAQRIANKTAEVKGAAEAAVDIEARLTAEFERRLAVRDAVRDEALRLGMAPEHVGLFAACQTPEDVAVQSAALTGYLDQTVKAHAAYMLDQMKAAGYQIVKNGAVVSASQASQGINGATNGAAPSNDPFAPMAAMNFAIPLANASRGAATPAKPQTFAEAREMVMKGLNIA